MESADKDLMWYALQVRPRFEKVVARNLQGKGYEEFVPLYRSRRHWSDRIREIEIPLFPGYVFCRFDVSDRLPILVVPGVISVVGIGKCPLAVAERELEDIRAVIKSGSHCEPWPFLQVGQLVRVEYGPLSGLEGVVVALKNTYRLVISVGLLRRSVAVEIDRDCLKPVPNRQSVSLKTTSTPVVVGDLIS